MKTAIFFAIVLLLGLVSADLNGHHHQKRHKKTALDRYVKRADPTFAYSHVSTIEGDGYTAYVMNLTSQTWLTAEDSSRSVWQHWVTICVPDDIDQDEVASVLVDSGSETTVPPTTLRTFSETLCTSTKALVATIQQIPNQPITFYADPTNQTRVEDAIIAYTWKHFLLDTEEPDWILRLPMTKAVVKCMDMVQEFSLVPTPSEFVVLGASKRGWTAWTTAAVDRRIKAVVPFVIPVLDMVPTFADMYRALGEWSFVLYDYLQLDVMDYLNDPVFLELGAIVDPLAYNKRLRMPKYIVCSTNDEFFLPDSTKHFYHKLKGHNNHLRIVPGVGHSMEPLRNDVNEAASSFVYMIAHDIDFPEYSWTMERSNTTNGVITLVSETTPTSVTVYAGSTVSTTARDFRQLTCPSAECFQYIPWNPTVLTPEADGKTYIAEVAVPTEGWTGFFVEVQYDILGSDFSPLKFTTEVNVLPDVYPFELSA